jgi:hypothetical protein
MDWRKIMLDVQTRELPDLVPADRDAARKLAAFDHITAEFRELNKKSPRQSRGVFFVPQGNLLYSGSPTPPTFFTKNNHAAERRGIRPERE